MKDYTPSKIPRRTLLTKLYDYFATPEWERPLVGFLILLLAPAGLAALALGPRFRALESFAAMDHAQLARGIFDGQGLSTSVIRPLSLLFKADLSMHPDLYNAPAHPILLGLWYCILHPSDRMTAAFGAGAWILSVWLTFWVARRWFGWPAAALSAVLYASNAAALMVSVGGLPHPLAALGVLAAVALVAPKPERVTRHPQGAGEDQGEAPPERLPAWRLWGAGVACAFTVLTHYTLAVLPLALAVYLALSQARKTRALRLFATGFVVPLLPWMLRGFLLTGSPFFSLFWYEALTNTRSYPGESVWRTLSTPPPDPLAFILSHPGEMARKLVAGMVRFREEAPGSMDPAACFLFLAALLGRRWGWWWRRLLAVVAASMVLFAVFSCLFRPETSLLLAWAPLLAIFGAAHSIGWLSANAGRIALGRVTIRRAWTRYGAYTVILGSATLPLLYIMAVAPRPGSAMLEERLTPLRRVLSPDARVLTDQPALVAWHGKRRAIWLPQSEGDLDALERTLGPVDAAYLTSGLALMPPEEKSAWWMWLAAPTGVYRGLAPTGLSLSGAVLRVRQR